MLDISSRITNTNALANLLSAIYQSVFAKGYDACF